MPLVHINFAELNNEFKSGFVSIIGMPNAGKSTLYNALMGDNLAIVNPKAQTTRHRILGIKTTNDYQIIFSDTPGILKNLSYKMHETMMRIVNESLEDSDVLILMCDVSRPEIPEDIQNRFNQFSGKKIFCLNKIDISDQQKVEEAMLLWKQKIAADLYFAISASNKFNLEILERSVIEFLPEHSPYFDSEDITDRSERFFVNEMVRNNILNLYSEEIPYSCEVVTMSFKEAEKIIRISCEIIVERESQKKIVIGTKGAAIKQLGISSRKQLEEFFQKQVYLELFVKIRENWRNNPNMLRQFGYDE
ncbi:MAG: GTPase Era [Bacteroidetes bacterium]|nr:GTPase Era [Bacteroidota bacterium]